MERLIPVARGAFYTLGTIVAALPGLAQESGALDGLGILSGYDLPGLGRVIVVLVAMTVLAVVAALASRRFWPQAAQRQDGALRLRAQLSLSSHLKLHVVETGRATIIVAEGRSGVAITELGGVHAQVAHGGDDAN